MTEQQLLPGEDAVGEAFVAMKMAYRALEQAMQGIRCEEPSNEAVASYRDAVAAVMVAARQLDEAQWERVVRLVTDVQREVLDIGDLRNEVSRLGLEVEGLRAAVHGGPAEPPASRDEPQPGSALV